MCVVYTEADTDEFTSLLVLETMLSPYTEICMHNIRGQLLLENKLVTRSDVKAFLVTNGTSVASNK